MARYKIVIEYDGSNLVGWQRQDIGTSIQGLLEESIFNFSQERVTVHGAGRTDAGVHAYAQVAHFDLLKELPLYKIREAINHFLKPNPISVIEVQRVRDDFHARFEAKQRSYVYRIINRSAPPALMSGKVWHIVKKLNIEKMNLAASYLIGKHDLSSFRALHCQAPSPIKSIDEIQVKCIEDEITIEIAAPSFLHNQVRIIVGTLVKIGKGEWDVEKMKEILDARERSKAGPTAPPHGLYFKSVKY